MGILCQIAFHIEARRGIAALNGTEPQKVLDGDLDEFIEASLKSGLEAGSKRSDAA